MLGRAARAECGPGLACIPSELLEAGCLDAFDEPSARCCARLCDHDRGSESCVGALGALCIYLGLGTTPEYGACVSTPVAPGELEIVEVYADPPGVAVSEPPLEYVEILNVSDADVELDSLALELTSPNPDAEPLTSRFTIVAGNSACIGGTARCLAAGQRALFVGSSYAGEVGGAMVFEHAGPWIFDALLQPTTPVFLYDPSAGLVVSSFRDWPDPGGPPLPEAELPMHRLDPLGPDQPENWASMPPSPGE